MRISDWSSDVCSSDLPSSLSSNRNPAISGFPALSRSTRIMMRSGTESSAPMVPQTHPQKLSASRISNGLIVSRRPTSRGVMKLASSAWIPRNANARSEEHTSELQSLMRISYAVFCLKKKKSKKKKKINKKQNTNSKCIYIKRINNNNIKCITEEHVHKNS